VSARIPIFAAAIIVALGLAGCVSNPVNAYTADQYYQYGILASEKGDFELAQRNFGRAYQNGQWGNLGPVSEAYSLYEWSMMTGYLGQYDEAEKGFNRALELIDKANGKADALRPPALCELARLLHDTGQHEKAIPVFDRAVTALDAADAPATDPIGFCLFLDDYAGSLRAAGFDSSAEKIAARSAVIREQNKGASAKFIARRYKT
jgi:tetratricopeptide (TPR) repeat protein